MLAMWIFQAGTLSHSLAVFFLCVGLVAKPAYGQASSAENPSSPGSFEKLSAQATSQREAGKIEESIDSYKSALQSNPGWAEGWWYLGTLNYDSDKYSEAIPAFRHLTELNPRMSAALAFLGLSEFAENDYPAALEHLRHGHDIGYVDDPDLAKVAEYHLAMLLNWNGEFEQASQLLQSKFDLSHAPAQIKTVLGMALLRIPLAPHQVDSSNDALIHSAGEVAARLADLSSEEGVQALQEMLAMYPKTPYLHYAYAKILATASKFDEALSQLSDETKTNPDGALPYMSRASIYLQLHRSQDAFIAAQAAVRLAPRLGAAHEILGRTLQELGKVEEAAKELEAAEALRSSPLQIDSSQRQLYLGNLTSPKASPTQTGEAAKPPSMESLNTEAQATFETLAKQAAAAQAAGQIDDSISLGQRALEIRPAWEEGWRNLGTMYYATARYREAIAAFKNATGINPGQGDSWALLGLSEFETKDYKNSLLHLERGRDLGFTGNKTSVQVAKYHLAFLLNKGGEFDKATELLIPESGPGEVEEQISLALGIAMLRIPSLPDEIDHKRDSLVQAAGETASFWAQSKYNKTFAAFQKIIQEYPNTPYLHYAYGCALAAVSRYDEAEQQLGEESKLTPDSALPYLRRASVALQRKQPENALQFAQRAIRLVPKSEEGHYLLGRAWLDMGKTEDAVHELQTARELAPNSPDVRFSLARAYAKAKLPEAAERERAAFERLNAAVERQRVHRVNQAYGSLQDLSGIRTAEQSEQPEAKPK